MRLTGVDYEALAKQVEDAVLALPLTQGGPVDAQGKSQPSS
jgi:hypothetical protein